MGKLTRIKYFKKEKRISIDIILDLNHFIIISPEERNKIVSEKIISEVPQIINKYKFNDFDLLKFQSDLISIMSNV